MSLLKVIFGRELTAEGFKRARENFSEKSIGFTREYEIKYFIGDGDKIIIEQKTFAWATTPDASEGWNRQHTGFYPIAQRTREYNPEGFLIKEVLMEGPPLHIGDSIKVKHFNPPGVWFGENVGKK